jgi:hypothetical protein
MVPQWEQAGKSECRIPLQVGHSSKREVVQTGQTYGSSAAVFAVSGKRRVLMLLRVQNEYLSGPRRIG